MMPVDRTGERGLGLENEPHRVLTYRDLVALTPNTDRRAPGRTVEIHLTGNMERFMWSFDGVRFSENPEPLREFSAYNDFSGENIAFLTRLAEWKSNEASEERLQDAYNDALAIYTDFISPRDAEFPLNISGQTLRRLEDVFEKPARILNGEAKGNAATPFDFGR